MILLKERGNETKHIPASLGDIDRNIRYCLPHNN
jgi:hypothetical protein